MGCGQSSNGTVRELSPPAVSPEIPRTVKDDVLDTCIETRQRGDVIDDPLPEEDFIDEILELMGSPEARRQTVDVQEGQLFSDPDFPASSKSLSCSRPDDPLLGDIVWLRPQDMCEQPAMFVDGISRGDVKQGILGDCWFLSACASIAMRPDLIEKVVPPGQKLYGPEHRGVVNICFWRFGEWITMPMDDLLPTRDGALVYASCANPSEFWVAFVEKAYAKLHGSYEALAGGHALEAFVDLTGGLAERHTITPDLFRLLRTAFKHGAFITCARKGDWQEDAVREKVAENGLVQGHAYTVTDVRRLPMGGSEPVPMVRVRNPWADDSEWTGTWCDSDVRWQSVDVTVKQSLGLKQLDDGEFWMEFADLQREFQEVTISTLGPDFDLDGLTDESEQEYEYYVRLNKKATALRVDVLSSRWVRSMPEHGDGLQVKMLHGSWVPGVNAGGSRNNMDSFATNPQYLITLHEPDDAFPDTNEAVAPRCSILIGLMQEHRRSERNRELRMLCIAFFLYKVSGDVERLDAGFLEREPEAASSGPFTNSREVMGRFELEPGRYVLVPATFQPGRARRYMLRVFALKPFSMRELPPSPACSTLSVGDGHCA